MPITSSPARRVMTADDLYDQLILSASSYGLDDGTYDAVSWCETFYYVESSQGGPLQPIRLAPHQKRILLDLTTRDENGKLPWVNIVFSAPKKSGKTTIAGMFCEWYAFNESAPNEIYILANDYEQAQGRIFLAFWKSLWACPSTRNIVGETFLPPKGKDLIILPNGTAVQALPNNYKGAAGSNHGLSLWSELTPVPTRPNSLRFVETYAGFTGESALLEDIYYRMVEHRESGEKRSEKRIYQDGFDVDGLHYDMDLPVYVDEPSKTYVYWDNSPRLPWQTPTYYESQQADLLPREFKRLHLNLWVSSVDAFITPELWYECEKPRTHDIWMRTVDLPVVLAADGAPKDDGTCLVAGSYDKETELVFLRKHWLWMPKEEETVKGQGMDFTSTIEEAVIAYCRNHEVIAFYYDPYQLHTTAMNLRRAVESRTYAGKPCPWMRNVQIIEFPQGAQRQKADSALYKLIQQGRIVAYRDDDLRGHVTGAQAKLYEEGKLRITKGKAGKVDLTVALSMLAWGAEEQAMLEPQWKTIEFLHL